MIRHTGRNRGSVINEKCLKGSEEKWAKMEENGNGRKVALITGVTGQVWCQNTYKGLMLVVVDLILLRKVEKTLHFDFHGNQNKRHFASSTADWSR